VPVIDYVRGLVYRSRGESKEALSLMWSAYRQYEKAGNRWRSVIALIALDETVARGPSRAFQYRSIASSIVAEHFPTSYLAGRVRRWNSGLNDPVVRSLSPTRLAVLRCLLDGMVPKAIAQEKGLAEKTIRHAIADLEDTFEVHSIQELIIACHRKGLSAASWSRADGQSSDIA
jgi:DNA-binding CsgD family transcriptional regulator